MGVSVSANLLDLSVRRRWSRESRNSRSSLRLRNPILEESTQQQHRPTSPVEQRRLSDPPSAKPPNKPPPPTTTAAVRRDSAQDSSSHIIRDHRINSNTLNSLHLTPFGTPTGNVNPAQDASAATNTPGIIMADIHVHRTIDDSAPAERERMASEHLLGAVEVDVEKSVAHSAPPAVGGRHTSIISPMPRTLRRANASLFDDDVLSAIAASPPPTAAPDAFNPWGLRHCASLSSTEATDQSKAVLATTHFKATYQRLCEEPRSRGNSTSAIRSVRTNSKDERRTASTQLSTEEWSRLLEMLDKGNTLICVDGGESSEPKRSHSMPFTATPNATAVEALPTYPPTDITPVSDEIPLAQNACSTVDDIRFTPLRMRFSSTGSFVSTGPQPEVDLQRAISAVDAHAANLRRLLTSWQDIARHHYEDFVHEMSAVLTAEHPSCYGIDSASATTTSTEEHARVMLQVIGQAVQLVSQMGDMFAVLLEMGAMHRRNDVGVGHFSALHHAFMTVLPRHITPEEGESLSEAVWEPFLQVVERLLVQGSRSERGEWYAAQRRKEWMEEARSAFEVLKEQQQREEDRGTFMPAVLDRAEAVNPAMAQLHLLREPRTAVRSFDGLAFAALELKDDAERARYLEQLAHDHIVYGLSESALREMRQPFIDTCHHFVQRSSRPQAWLMTSAESLGLFWDMVTTHWVDGIALSRRSLADIRGLSAPSGSRPFCMLFTEIEASARLWELHPSNMAAAVEAHNALLRRLIAKHGAYEVKADGDAFIIAARDVATALHIAVAAQLELMRGPIAEAFHMVPVVQGGGLQSCWREDSLRLRMGIHHCTDASAVYDSVQRRFDYYGPSVNCAARVAAAAAGGQILLSQDAVDALRVVGAETAAESLMPMAEIPRGGNPMDAILDSLLEFQWWGEQRFRGLSEPIGLYSVLPMRLAGRTFPFYVGSRKVRVSAPCDIAGQKKVCRVSLSQLKSGNIDTADMKRLRGR